MAEIAEMIGVSRQRVAQLTESYEDFPRPEVELTGGRVWSRTAVETWIASHPERGPGRPEPEDRKGRFFGRQSSVMFDRFTDRARSSVVKAQQEARLLSHNYIGTEHLLLGLIAIGEGLAFQVLAGFGVGLESVRDEIEQMIGRGKSPPQGHIPFTPRAKTALEHAAREALKLGHNYVGTEHVLIGLIGERDGVAWKALERLGLRPGATRKAIMEALQRLVQAQGAGPREQSLTEGLVCSFCFKTQAEVGALVAGPGSLSICDECIARAADIIGEEQPTSTGTDRIVELERRIEKLEEREATD
jgi:predicted DNA-binding transcriptional regulator AlpA